MRHNLVTISIFLLLIIAITFPLALNLNSYIPGFFSTDEPYAALWNFWMRKTSLENQLSLEHVYFIAYPWGRVISASGFLPPILWISFINVLAFFTTSVLTFNIQAIMNLFLSTYLAYLLIFHLTKVRIPSIFGAIAFGFCPYQFMRVWQHLGLTYNEWMVLVLFSAILLKEKNILRHKIIFILSLILLFSFDYSIMYFATFALFLFSLYSLIYRWKEKIRGNSGILTGDLKYCFTLFVLGLISLIPHLPGLLPSFRHILNPGVGVASAFNSYFRPFEDLFSQSARPLSYFLPATVHPVFGRFSEHFIGSSLYGVSFTEHTLYLGWVPLILAFLAFRRWRKRNKGQSPWAGKVNSSSGESPFAREDFYIGFFIFLAIVAWLFSQPPWWNVGPLKIYMPSFFMYKLLPMFRAYCRFGIVVMLAVAVLAGFGLKFILDRFKKKKTKVAITTLFCGLVLFEFWNWPPYKVIDVSKVPAVYYWLREQPGDFVIAEYPIDAESTNERYKFYQTKHEKKIINGTIPGTYANQVAQTIKKLSEPKTAGRLKGMGVRYALVHRDGYLETGLIEWIEELNKIPQNPGLKLVRSFSTQECPRKDIMCVQKTGPIDVYEVLAQPIVPEIKGNGS